MDRDIARALRLSPVAAACGQRGKPPPEMKTVLIAAVLLIHASALAEPAAVAKQTRAWRAAHEREILTEFVELLSIPNLATRRAEHSTERRSDPRHVRKARTHREASRHSKARRPSSWPISPRRMRNARSPSTPITMDSRSIHRSGKAIPGNRSCAITPARKSIGAQRNRSIRNRASSPAPPVTTKRPSSRCSRRSTPSAPRTLKPSVNLRFVFEGEEEAGSPHLADYLKKFPRRRPRRRLGFLRWPRASKPADGARLRRARHDRSRSDRLRSRQRLARRPLRQLGAESDCSPHPSASIRCGTRPAAF